MRHSYTELESSIACSMIEEALKNDEIKRTLADIASVLIRTVLSDIRQKEQQGMKPKLNTLALCNSKDDKYIGALLPEYDADYLEKNPEGRQKLLDALEQCLQKAATISSTHDFLALMKAVDSMAYMYDVIETDKASDPHRKCKQYLAPTPEETAVRKPRPDKLVATTYGIGTVQGKDLAAQAVKFNYSGKARFFIRPTGSGVKPIWLEQMADQSSVDKPPLPLIATASNATAKNFMMMHGLELFKKQDGQFDLKSAQIFANCFMAYLVYCGHHSFLEVAEIWNRQLDYLVLEKPEQLPKNLRSMEATEGVYMNNTAALERHLPYAHIGDHASFLHPSYADRVVDEATKQLDDINGLNLNL